MPVWTHYFAHFVVTVIATIAFGITFQVPRRHYLAAGITGAVGWMVYIFGVELLGMSPAIATLVATLPLTGCARFFSITHKAPVTIFLLPGIFPLVPGSGKLHISAMPRASARATLNVSPPLLANNSCSPCKK